MQNFAGYVSSSLGCEEERCTRDIIDLTWPLDRRKRKGSLRDSFGVWKSGDQFGSDVTWCNCIGGNAEFSRLQRDSTGKAEQSGFRS
jgi:hypothetical protein